MPRNELSNGRRGSNRRVDRVVARIVPVILLGAFGTGSYLFTQRLCVDYLLQEPTDATQPRSKATAIAFLIVYYLLLAQTIISFFRLIQVITTSPGLIPRGPGWVEANAPATPSFEKLSSRPERSADTVNTFHEGEITHVLGEKATDFPRGTEAESGGRFWLKDIYVCNHDGLPTWCSTCLNWKSDRGHHCSEINRCVYKMDHFCPWVGGIVSETSYKFFLQFVFYAAVYCIFTLSGFAVYLAKIREESSSVNGFWIGGLALATLFGFFSLGMFGSTLDMALRNITTIENLDRKTRAWTLAIIIPDIQRFQHTASLDTHQTDPAPAESLGQTNVRFPFSTTTFDPDNPGLPPRQILPEVSFALPPGKRTFAILSTEPGENPFYLTPFQNLQQIMGHSIWDWLLPVRMSPCVDHSNPTSAYPMGSVVEELKIRNGILGQLEAARYRVVECTGCEMVFITKGIDEAFWQR